MTAATFFAVVIFVGIGFAILFILLFKDYRKGSGMLRAWPPEVRIEFDRDWRRGALSPAQNRPAAGSAPRRRWLEAKGMRWYYPLDGRSLIYLGRHQDNQVVLKDKAADGRQAVIYWEDGRYKINNLSVRSHTRVNGRPITKQNLGDGNSITMGGTVLVFRDCGDAGGRRKPARR
ncbi:FHA domain-containing protein [uncultured Thiohalocapsa sp.]|uniref:FHA domain-containing protein n=1 Tax=uncultured Thiohalocapsa sp. TaxID=768990 RepID=UPI0025F3606A|nr:FHA domain-containing protein [uncultured Thiohalocapsa sp.]